MSNLTVTHAEIKAIGDAIMNGDKKTLSKLIESECNIQDEYLKVVEAEPSIFIDWILKRREEMLRFNSLSYRVFYCDYCEKGASILLFNEGRFPYLAWISSNVCFAGLKVCRDEKGIGVVFCFNYPGVKMIDFFDQHSDELKRLEKAGDFSMNIILRIFLRETGRRYSHPSQPGLHDFLYEDIENEWKSSLN